MDFDADTDEFNITSGSGRDVFVMKLDPDGFLEWAVSMEGLGINDNVRAQLVERLPQETLWEDFTDKKYGTYYRNLHGIIEHTHYHLGQILIIKKIIHAQTHP